MASIFESATSAVTIDLKAKNRLKMIDAVQGESDTRKIAFTILSGGNEVEIPNGTTVKIAFKTAAGTGGYYSKLHDDSSAYSIDGNVVTITVVQEALSAAGITMLVVILENASGKRIATFPVEISVSPNPEQEALEPANYYEIEDIVSEAMSSKVSKSGDTMTGALIIDPDMIAPNATIFSVGDGAGNEIEVYPTGTSLRVRANGSSVYLTPGNFKISSNVGYTPDNGDVVNLGIIKDLIAAIPTKTVTVTYTDGTTDSFGMLVGGANS